tara:strand:+ start:93 stop:1067 length:975 start_codon:yes stop_codon:yes gene_type:complete
MKKKYKKLIVLCKGDSVTGGSELVHQFCHELNSLSLDSSIAYYPLSEKYLVPEEYSIYDVKLSKLEDEHDNIIMLPEVATKFAYKIKTAKIAIWWLSVDNYYRKKGDNLIKDSVKYYKDLLRLRLVPLMLMKNYFHFVQSSYAKDHLSMRGLESEFLSDYLNPIHFNQSSKIKEDIILYNPVKGAKITKGLISANRDFTFIPLEKLSNIQVQDLFKRAKVYIDFGNHPGKDRMPREAAMADCCIITGKRGSANNSIDVPIPQKYKFDDSKSVDNSMFRQIVLDIFSDYQKNVLNFGKYKDIIKNEQTIFKNQVSKIFKNLLHAK